MRVETIGDATLYCMDSHELFGPPGNREAADAAGYVVVTDPPYGIAHKGDSSRFSGGNTRRGRGSTHGQIIGDDRPFDPTPFLFGRHQILFGANNFLQHLTPGSLLIWAKRRPAAYGTFLSDGEVAWFSKGRGIYMFEHTFAGSSAAVEYSGDAYAPSAHPFQKPVAVMEWCLSFVPDAETICDPFMGSGTTGVAAVRAGKKFVGVEIDERYFKVACKRIEAAHREPSMFVQSPAKPAQEAML
jgi:site-specific DNA-methyltransferase (adenine-specific)